MTRWMFAAVLMLALSPAIPARATVAPSAIDLVRRHAASQIAGDLDAMMADYAPDAIVIQRHRVIGGSAAIRNSFEAAVGRGVKDRIVLKPLRIWEEGGVVLMDWSTNVEMRGREIFYLRNGKILVDTVFFDAQDPVTLKIQSP